MALPPDRKVTNVQLYLIQMGAVTLEFPFCKIYYVYFRGHELAKKEMHFLEQVIFAKSIPTIYNVILFLIRNYFENLKDFEQNT